MKRIISFSVTVIILLIVSSFTLGATEKLSKKQEDQFKKEVSTIFDSIMIRLERLDLAGALEYYSPDFVAFGVDGKKYTLAQVRDQYEAGFKVSQSYKWTTYSLDFLVMTKDIIVITVDGKNDSVFKSGSKLVYDPSHYSFAFKRINGQWKLYYHHFSGTLVR
jgi:hypothetical protein